MPRIPADLTWSYALVTQLWKPIRLSSVWRSRISCFSSLIWQYFLSHFVIFICFWVLIWSFGLVSDNTKLLYFQVSTNNSRPTTQNDWYPTIHLGLYQIINAWENWSWKRETHSHLKVFRLQIVQSSKEINMVMDTCIWAMK